ncbi:hypothetical protein CSUI_003927 [Cystoisospora suis]|uniref:Uncharacterized protein n=1 Tax=Cystoisospora suis TaxID=483139 RepID=A0A2C6KZ10_9APIC|nr:hypothetical protein CSUI_003927 [Cystoisospora suis]
MYLSLSIYLSLIYVSKYRFTVLCAIQDARVIFA